MQSWLEGRNWVGKCAQATGMTASLWILSSKANSNTWGELDKEWTEAGPSVSKTTGGILLLCHRECFNILSYGVVWGLFRSWQKSSTEGHKERSKYHWLPSLPLLLDIANTRYLSRAKNIVKDFSHPPVTICFSLLPSGRRYRSIKHAQPDFQIVFIQEPFSPWTKDVLWTVQ